LVALVGSCALLLGPGLVPGGRAAARQQTQESAAPVVVGVAADHPGPAMAQDLLGVNQSVAGGVAAMRAIGVRWARTDVSFEGSFNAKPSYDCGSGVWDPALLDSRIAVDRREGAEPQVLVDYTPACLATRVPPGTNPSFSPPDPVRWAALVKQMAGHEIAAGVRTFEVWNEPDGFFWTGTLAEYLRLYEETAAAIGEAAGALGVTVRVGGPALTFPDWPWIEALLDDADRSHLPLDFVSWHYYANYPLVGPVGPVPAPPAGTPPAWYSPLTRAQTYGQQIQQVRAQVARHHGLHPLLWIDEWNLDAGYDARHDGPYDAALTLAVLDSMQQAGLDRSCFFRVADDGPGTLGNWGLLFSDLRPKPVYQALRFWHEAAGASLPVTLPPGADVADPAGRVGAVASSRAGATSVLVYNVVPFDPTGSDGAVDPTPYDHPVTVSVSGLAPGRYGLTRELVDGAHSGQVVDRGLAQVGRDGRLTVSFILAGDGVSLLRIHPR
jgi:hypothetical protein